MTREPIRAAYEQSGALYRDCPLCDAAPGQWCVDPRGRLRRVPCVLRTRGPVEPRLDATDRAADFSEPRHERADT